MPAKRQYRGMLSDMLEGRDALTRLCRRLGIDPSLPDAKKYELIGRKLAPEQKEFQKRGRPPSRRPFTVMSDDELLSRTVDMIKSHGLATTDKDALEIFKSALRENPDNEFARRLWPPNITNETRLKKVSQGRKLRKFKVAYKNDTRRLDFGLRKKT